MNDAIALSVSGGNETLWSFHAFAGTQGRVVCTDKGVRIVIEEWDDSGPGGAAGMTWALSLRLASDGSLLVMSKKRESGMSFIIPYSFGSSKWYKFAKKESPVGAAVIVPICARRAAGV